MSLTEELELLREVPLFAGIDPARLKLLAFVSDRVNFDSGTRLFLQGDPADAAYLIIDGRADVFAETPNGPLLLATLGPHQTVGEMGILCDAPRNATVIANGRLVTLRISKDLFLQMLQEFPTMATALTRVLAKRLSDMNLKFQDALLPKDRL